MKTKVIGDMIIGKEHFKELRPQPSIQPKYDTIWDAYGKPSKEKETIWYHWIDFVAELEDAPHVMLIWDNMGVYSRNCSKYTICFRFSFEGTAYQALITKEHNYIWEVDDYEIC